MKRIILVLLLLIALVGGYAYYQKQKEPSLPPKNVLLITIDTLRADHLGCYGYPRATSPNIDAWSKEGTIFTNATAAVPLTLPSHSTIMTGEYPFAHGVRDNGGFYLDNKWKTIAEVTRAAGMHTGGFISAFVLDRRWGIAQGFDEYFDNFELSKFKMVSLDSVQRRGDETLSHAISWLDRNKDSRFFAWIHFYDPHTPYDPPEPFNTEFQQYPYGLYDGEIAYTDNLVGRIHEYLQKNNLLSNTLVILTADHGESLGEHEESAHGYFVYDATTHVPLIIWKPGEEPRKIADQVRSVDLYATICDALGIKPGQPGPGTSLVPLIQGRTLPEKLLAYSESYYPKFHYGWSELKALRTPDYKYIDAPRKEFYRLSEDAQEKFNLYPQDKRRAGGFEISLANLVKSNGEPSAPQAVDNDSLEKLQALGYIGSYVNAPRDSGEALADPKDKIRLYNLVKIAQSFSSEDKNSEAMSRIREVLVEDPKILEAHLVLGNL
jgi:arylsulfatase A-like enzyme